MWETLLAVVLVFVVAIAAILQVVSMTLQTFASLYLHSILPNNTSVVTSESIDDNQTVIDGFSRKPTA